jgi:hypothetical protein
MAVSLKARWAEGKVTLGAFETCSISVELGRKGMVWFFGETSRSRHAKFPNQFPYIRFKL